MFNTLKQSGYEFDPIQIKESLSFTGATVFAPEESKVEKLIETQTAKNLEERPKAHYSAINE